MKGRIVHVMQMVPALQMGEKIALFVTVTMRQSKVPTVLVLCEASTQRLLRSVVAQTLHAIIMAIKVTELAINRIMKSTQPVLMNIQALAASVRQLRAQTFLQETNVTTKLVLCDIALIQRLLVRACLLALWIL